MIRSFIFFWNNMSYTGVPGNLAERRTAHKQDENTYIVFQQSEWNQAFKFTQKNRDWYQIEYSNGAEPQCLV